jgi:hypothetical protein
MVGTMFQRCVPDMDDESSMFDEFTHFQLMKTAPAPVTADRIIDAAALLFLTSGVLLFAFARNALIGLANDTRYVPEGMSAVAVTDFHVAQSKMGLVLVGLGIVVGIAAAVRHKLRKH